MTETQNTHEELDAESTKLLQDIWATVLTDETNPVNEKKSKVVPYLKEPMTPKQESLSFENISLLLCPLTINQTLNDLKTYDPNLEIFCGSNYTLAVDNDGKLEPLEYSNGDTVIKVFEWDELPEHLSAYRPTVQELIDHLEQVSPEHRDDLFRAYDSWFYEKQSIEDDSTLKYVAGMDYYQGSLVLGIWDCGEEDEED